MSQTGIGLNLTDSSVVPGIHTFEIFINAHIKKKYKGSCTRDINTASAVDKWNQSGAKRLGSST